MGGYRTRNSCERVAGLRFARAGACEAADARADAEARDGAEARVGALERLRFACADARVAAALETLLVLRADLARRTIRRLVAMPYRIATAVASKLRPRRRP